MTRGEHWPCTPTSPFRGAIVHPVGLPAVATHEAARIHHALGGAAAWPLAARAQQPERVRRIGVLLPAAADDPEFQVRIAAFHQGLALLGWTIGRNVRIDTRWATTNAAEIRRHAAELAALAPDVILAHGTATVGPLLQATRTVPIVFPVVADPVGAGFVDSLARPGGNATGFMTVRIQHGREMAGIAQADRARRDASGDPPGCDPRRRDRPVCRHPGRGAVAHGGGQPGQHARRRRDRAHRRGLRALSQWRSDRGGGRWPLRFIAI